MLCGSRSLILWWCCHLSSEPINACDQLHSIASISCKTLHTVFRIKNSKKNNFFVWNFFWIWISKGYFCGILKYFNWKVPKNFYIDNPNKTIFGEIFQIPFCSMGYPDRICGKVFSVGGMLLHGLLLYHQENRQTIDFSWLIYHMLRRRSLYKHRFPKL